MAKKQLSEGIIDFISRLTKDEAGFTSKLQREIAQAKSKQMPADQWEKYLLSKGVKRQEMKDIGLLDYLDDIQKEAGDNPVKVTKEGLFDFVTENRPDFEPKVLEAGTGDGGVDVDDLTFQDSLEQLDMWDAGEDDYMMENVRENFSYYADDFLDDLRGTNSYDEMVQEEIDSIIDDIDPTEATFDMEDVDIRNQAEESIESYIRDLIDSDDLDGSYLSSEYNDFIQRKAEELYEENPVYTGSAYIDGRDGNYYEYRLQGNDDRGYTVYDDNWNYIDDVYDLDDADQAARNHMVENNPEALYGDSGETEYMDYRYDGFSDKIEDYEERLLKDRAAIDKDAEWSGAHYNEEDMNWWSRGGWMRDPDLGPISFIEEFQSDLHSAARKKGPKTRPNMIERFGQLNEDGTRSLPRIGYKGDVDVDALTMEAAAELDILRRSEVDQLIARYRKDPDLLKADIDGIKEIMPQSGFHGYMTDASGKWDEKLLEDLEENPGAVYDKIFPPSTIGSSGYRYMADGSGRFLNEKVADEFLEGLTGAQETLVEARLRGFDTSRVVNPTAPATGEINMGLQSIGQYKRDLRSYIDDVTKFYNKAPPAGVAVHGEAWVDAALKDAIMDAISKNHKGISWTNAEQQTDFWGLQFSEGYNTLYNKQMVKAAQKIAKKYGMKLELKDYGLGPGKNAVLSWDDDTARKIADEGMDLYKAPPIVPYAGALTAAAGATSLFPEDSQAGSKSLVDDLLKMDYLSRMKRAEQMRNTTDSYTGSTHDISIFDGSLSNPENDFGKGVYSSSSIDDVNYNYAGKGPDLTARIEIEKERIADEVMVEPEILEDYGINMEQWESDPDRYARVIAEARLVGDAEHGVVYPLKLNTDQYAVIGGDNRTIVPTKDYMAEAADEFDMKDFDTEDEYWDAVAEMAQENEAWDMEHPYLRIRESLAQQGIADSYIDRIMGDVEPSEIDLTVLDEAIRDNVIEAYDPFTGEPMSPGAVSAAVIQDLGYKGIVDNTAGRKFGRHMAGVDGDTTHYITFPEHENTIRSRHAKFDPEQKDVNDPLASVALPAAGATGLWAMAGSEDVPASIIPPEATDRPKIVDGEMTPIGGYTLPKWSEQSIWEPYQVPENGPEMSARPPTGPGESTMGFPQLMNTMGRGLMADVESAPWFYLTLATAIANMDKTGVKSWGDVANKFEDKWDTAGSFWDQFLPSEDDAFRHWQPNTWENPEKYDGWETPYYMTGPMLNWFL